MGFKVAPVLSWVDKFNLSELSTICYGLISVNTAGVHWWGFDHLVRIDLNCGRRLKWFHLWGKMWWQVLNLQGYRESFISWIQSISSFMNRMATFHAGGKIKLQTQLIHWFSKPYMGAKRAVQSCASRDICLCILVPLQLRGRRWPVLPVSKNHLLSQYSKIPVFVN